MRIIAIDGGDEKRDLCKKLGAEEFIDFTQVSDPAAEVMKLTKYGAHGVIVTAATKEAYASAPGFLRPGGTVVAVGLPKDPTVLAGAPPLMLCLRKLNIVGSVVGTLKDVEEALDFTARGLVHVSEVPFHTCRLEREREREKERERSANSTNQFSSPS
jgi:propanol-preferring alcohol dehydrogenase